MAEAQTTQIFDCTPEQFFKIVSDYEKYPEFLPEVKSVKIFNRTKEYLEMEYHVSLMKTFKYKLKATEKSPNYVEFHYTEGDVFKTMTGRWDIKPEGKNKCLVDYKVSATFGILVPGPMAKAMVSANLPLMINNFKSRVKKLYGTK